MNKSINKNTDFDGIKLVDAILIVLFISLLIFGSTDISNLTNAPSS